MSIINPAKILLPKDGINYEKWAVVACDQYTGSKSYWNEVAELVKQEPSTLNIILPEAQLGDTNISKAAKLISEKMSLYSGAVLLKEIDGMVLVLRRAKNDRLRVGLIATIDLEKYSFTKGEQSAVRPSENTVKERLPARVAIRNAATIESPHILMLIDDKEKRILEPLAKETELFKELYHFELMKNGGDIQGFSITNKKMISDIVESIEIGMKKTIFKKKYSTEKEPFVLAVGDGNHSLASAKQHYEQLKKKLSKSAAAKHPARYCLVEIVNLYSDAIEMEPIHRVIFGMQISDMKSEAMQFFKKQGNENIAFEYKNALYSFSCCEKTYRLPIHAVDGFIEHLQKKYKNIEVDYIHGEKQYKQHIKDGAIGFKLPKIPKEMLFSEIISYGEMPKKSFSLGEPEEKRFYLECRKIVE